MSIRIKVITIALIAVFVVSGFVLGPQKSSEEDTVSPKSSVREELSILPVGDPEPIIDNVDKNKTIIPREPQDTVKEEKINAEITFTVTIPDNTPEEDIIFINIWPHGEWAMTKAEEPFTYTITFSPDDEIKAIDEESGEEVIYYQYSRNGWGFTAAEYKEPDDPEEYGKVRKVAYKLGLDEQDTVRRWRWFPSQGNAKTDTYLLPSKLFLARTGGVDFRSGQLLQDLYIPAFESFFDSTALHMKSKGYNWVTIEPPWQWLENDPPVIGNSLELGNTDVPNYPDDESLIRHIKAFKKKGISVLLGPQICCTSLSFQDRSSQWWAAYFDEVERFLVHHAKIATTAGVDALFMPLFEPIGHESGLDIDARWRLIWQNVKKEFSGEIGVGVMNFGVSNVTSAIPSAQDISWGDMLDFFVFMNDSEMTISSNPSDENLFKEAGRIVDIAKPFYDRYKKPIMLQLGYFSIEDTWKGGALYDDIEFIGNADLFAESALREAGYSFSGEDQARVIHAYLSAIRDRPWIIGFSNGGYWHWEMPLSPGQSVRGKQAETIWERWNRLIF
jgi:hypothetical protein